MDEIAVDVPPEEETKAPGKAISKLMADYPEVELATLVDAPPEGEQWLHELKFDGYRLLAFLADGEVRLRTRNGNDWTRKFPSLYASVAKLKAKSVVLDLKPWSWTAPVKAVSRPCDKRWARAVIANPFKATFSICFISTARTSLAHRSQPVRKRSNFC
jgi:hypothetical protein